MANYEAAKELAAFLDAEWRSRGCPLIGMGGATGRAEVPHPILTQLQHARRDVDKFGRTLGLGKAHAGPSPVAVVSATIGKAPSSVTPIRRKRA